MKREREGKWKKERGGGKGRIEGGNRRKRKEIQGREGRGREEE